MQVRSIRLVGIVLSLFCLARHLPHLRGLETQYTRLGFGGYWGSKGVVSTFQTTVQFYTNLSRFQCGSGFTGFLSAC